MLDVGTARLCASRRLPGLVDDRPPRARQCLVDTLGVVDRDEVLGSARTAAADHAWEDAFAAYRAADALDELSPEDLETLSIAAFCVSRMPEAMDARQRAYAHYERAGRTPEAASAALNV